MKTQKLIGLGVYGYLIPNTEEIDPFVQEVINNNARFRQIGDNMKCVKNKMNNINDNLELF